LPIYFCLSITSSNIYFSIKIYHAVIISNMLSIIAQIVPLFIYGMKDWNFSNPVTATCDVKRPNRNECRAWHRLSHCNLAKILTLCLASNSRLTLLHEVNMQIRHFVTYNIEIYLPVILNEIRNWWRKIKYLWLYERFKINLRIYRDYNDEQMILFNFKSYHRI